MQYNHIIIIIYFPPQGNNYLRNNAIFILHLRIIICYENQFVKYKILLLF